MNRPSNYISEQGKIKISESSSRNISIFTIDNVFLCNFKNIIEASSYLNCSYKTIQRALIKGFIYMPIPFESYLNNEYLNKHKSLPIEDIKISQLNIIESRKKEGIKYRIVNEGPNLQAGLKNNFCFNKYIIK